MTTKAEYRAHNDREALSRALRVFVRERALDLGIGRPSVSVPFAEFAARCAPMTEAKVLLMIRNHPVLVAETLGIERGVYEPSRYVKGVGQTKAQLRLEPMRLAKAV